ncbi:hypothetical protein KFO32_05790 [Pantoea ananatis]|uniref:hypothetical protein n=1 Tax=Pantoea ananas TaxID=553 RepID=UPI001FF4479D|nr:hypothetical protein [Pantoea ananatis]MCK0552587.1 hypothetical protein [Pantoea ananatis]
MQTIELSEKMPTIDTLKTAGVIGLLMQQTVAVYDVDAVKPASAAASCEVYCGYDKKQMISTIDEALAYLAELTEHLNQTYSSLAEASNDEAETLLKMLRSSRIELIEQQLRAMDGTGKAVYKDASEERKANIKPIVMTVAMARSAASDLNHLIRQMTVPVDVFNSDIDKDALSALAKHGTNVFNSGNFH